MKSKKETSPVRSRDKVIQSLYEIELSGSDLKDILADLAKSARISFKSEPDNSIS